MKFLADVNIPQSVINTLRKLNHQVLDLKKVGLMYSDVEVVRRAKQEGRIILTRDKDFIVLTQFPKYQVATIVIRLKDQKPETILKYLLQLIGKQDAKILQKSLTIVTEDSADSHRF